MQKNLRFKKDVSLAKYHTYGVDAKAKYLVEVYSQQNLFDAIEFSNRNKITYSIIGKGSNILFRDNYFPGLIIVNKLTKTEVKKSKIWVESGVSTQLLARKAAKNNLSGLQWFVGVPGTVGGAIFMNAGCESYSTSDFLEYVEVYYLGEKKKIPKEECEFAYRKSVFQTSTYIILGASFNLTYDIFAKDSILKFQKKRLNAQPIEKKNSGCIFVNPKEGLSAGRLIDECGLKGLVYKGAEVSVKHANFINNRGNASSEDIEKLIAIVKKRVKEKKGVDLEYEIRVL